MHDATHQQGRPPDALPHDNTLGRVQTMTDTGLTYCRVAVGDMVACLTVHAGGRFADFEGLVWCGGKVAFEFSGSVSVQDGDLEAALEAALSARLRQRAGRKAHRSDAPGFPGWP